MTCAQTNTRSRTRVVPSCPNRCESRCETGADDAGHSLSPSAIRVACHSSREIAIVAISARIRSASPRCEPSKRRGLCTLRIHSALSDADEDEHGEQIGEEGVPALISQPREGGVLGDDADHRDDDRRAEDEEAPEDEGVDQPGDDPLQQLALAEHDRRLVAHATLPVAGARGGSRRAHEVHEEPHPQGKQGSARRQQRGEHDGGDGDAYVPFTFLISAEIAGTTSCRSPMTA